MRRRRRKRDRWYSAPVMVKRKSRLGEAPPVELTAEQLNAGQRALDCYHSGGKLFRIGGYAGTGKTTLARWIVEQIGRVAVCSFTGKAVSVLRSKGLLDAQTMHGTMYNYEEATKTFRRLPAIDADAVLVDEGSMVNQQLWDDLLTFRMCNIVIGDPGQLDPVGEDPRLMHNPDVVLEEIHRQAAESAIIQFATHVRHRHSFKHGTKGEVEVRGEQLFWDSIDWADQMLCGFNKTRVAANALYRKHRGYSNILEEGERIIVLKNNRDFQVFNGMMLTIHRIRDQSKEVIECDVVTDDGTQLNLPIWTGNFGQLKTINLRDEGIYAPPSVQADYGPCITVHKAQGSEWPKVAVLDEQCRAWDPIRHRYTAITRAAQELRYAINL